jgi:hypothetical protein
MMKLRKSGDDLFFAFTSKTTTPLMPPSQPLINQLWNQFRRRYIARSFLLSIPKNLSRLEPHGTFPSPPREGRDLLFIVFGANILLPH